MESRQEDPEHDLDNRSETVTVSGDRPTDMQEPQGSNVFEALQDEERQSVASNEQVDTQISSQLASERTPLRMENNQMNFPGLLLSRELPPQSPGQLSNVSMASISTADDHMWK